MFYLNPQWIRFRQTKTTAKNSNKWLVVIALVLVMLLLCKFQLKGSKWQYMQDLWSPLWLAIVALLYKVSLTLIGEKGKHSLVNKSGANCSIGIYYVYVSLFVLSSAFYVSPAWTTWIDSYSSVLLVGLYWYVNLFIPLSLLFTSLHISYFLFKIHSRKMEAYQYLLLMLTSSFIIVSFLMFLPLALHFVGYAGGDFDYSLFIYTVLAFDLVLICWFFIRLGSYRIHNDLAFVAHDSLGVPKRKYRYGSLEKNKDLYVDKLKAHLESTACYLDPNLTLMDVAEQVALPKHHVSEIINMEFEKNFFQYLADYRIAHAMKYLSSHDSSIKIETLAYECGFNSKTSFNRYFKERNNGLTPSEYRSRFYRLC